MAQKSKSEKAKSWMPGYSALERFTPGPWTVETGTVVVPGVGILLKADRENPNTFPVERDANIKMASKAPEAIAILIDILGCYDEDEKKDEPINGTDAVDNLMEWVRRIRPIIADLKKQ